jgi:lipopolysaccharide transport system permease protein
VEAVVRTAEPPVYEIIPERGWAGLGLRELWRYRELVFFMTWRTILVRYKQTWLGVAWAAVQPVMLMVVFSLFFSSFAKKSGLNIPGPIFFMAGVVPWTFFASAVGASANSLVGNANLLSKVYFPRLAAPLSSIFSTLVDFVIAFAILFGMMAYYGIYPGVISIVVLPALLLLAFISALGVGLWLSAMNVAYRDVQYVVPFLIQLGLFASGVAFSAAKLSEPWRTVIGANPMTGVVTGFRWALVGGQTAIGPMIGVSVGVALLLLASGALYFRRMERSFADVI